LFKPREYFLSLLITTAKLFTSDSRFKQTQTSEKTVSITGTILAFWAESMFRGKSGLTYDVNVDGQKLELKMEKTLIPVDSGLDSNLIATASISGYKSPAQLTWDTRWRYTDHTTSATNMWAHMQSHLDFTPWSKKQGPNMGKCTGDSEINIAIEKAHSFFMNLTVRLLWECANFIFDQVANLYAYFFLFF